MNRVRYHLRVPDLAAAHGADAEFAFVETSPQALEATVLRVLREPTLFERWRDRQPDPDLVDPSLGAVDANATVQASVSAPRVDLVVTTTLPHAIVQHRLNLLLGRHWQLADVQHV